MPLRTEHEDKRPDWNDECEPDVDEVRLRSRTTTRARKRDDGHRVERLVQQNDEKSPKSSDRTSAARGEISHHRRRERNALEKTVKGHADSRADPRSLADAMMSVRWRPTLRSRLPMACERRMVVTIAARIMFMRRFKRLVLVIMKESFEQEHDREASKHRQNHAIKTRMHRTVRIVPPRGGAVHRGLKREHHGVRKEMEEPDPQHHARDHTQRQLQSAVPEFQRCRQRAAGHGRKTDEADEDAEHSRLLIERG